MFIGVSKGFDPISTTFLYILYFATPYKHWVYEGNFISSVALARYPLASPPFVTAQA